MRRFPFRQCGDRLAGSTRGPRAMQFRQVTRQFTDGWIVVEVVGRKFQAELVFELHLQIDRHRRVETEAAELGVDLNDILWNAEDVSQRGDTKPQNLSLFHDPPTRTWTLRKALRAPD